MVRRRFQPHRSLMLHLLVMVHLVMAHQVDRFQIWMILVSRKDVPSFRWYWIWQPIRGRCNSPSQKLGA